MLLRADIKIALYTLVLAAIALFCAAIPASEAYASSGSWYVPEQAASAVEGETFCPDRMDGITARVVYCMQAIIIQATKNFLEAFVEIMRPIIVAILVLSITLYGALVLVGSAVINRDTLMLAIKIGAVVTFTGVVSSAPVFGGMIDAVFDTMEGLMQIVSSYVVTGSSIAYCSDQSQMPNVFQIPRAESHTAWDNIDCMFISLLGLGPNAITMVAGEGGTAHPMVAGLIVVLAGVLFLGGVGIILLLLGLFFILTLLVSIVRAVKIYLGAVVVVSFLICISPITIPLVLFSATRQMFHGWLQHLIANMLIPIFLMAYLTVIVAAIDAIIFKGTSSLYWSIAREASQTEGFNMRTWLYTGADGNGYAEPNVPGTAAVGLMSNIRICDGGDEALKEKMGEICNDVPALRGMLDCAIDPLVLDVPDQNSGEELPELPDLSDVSSCEDLHEKLSDETGSNVYPYRGYMMNAEVFAFSITPDMETDVDKREAAKGCGSLFGCVGSFIGTVAGGIVDGVKWVVGQVGGFLGSVLNLLGDLLKGVASIVSYPCRVLPGTVGDVCNFATGGTAINFLGDVVHASGSVANFGSRVLLDGIMAALGWDDLPGFLDVQVIDFQKIASYQCKMDYKRTGGGDLSPTDEVAYLDNCPGVLNLLVQVVYVLISALVVIFLLFKWLPQIVVIANNISSATLPSDMYNLPFENGFSKMLQSGAGKVASSIGGKGGGK